MITKHGRAEAQAEMQTPCRLCGGPSTFAFVVGDRNRGLGAGRFHYFQCRACKATFLADVPSDLGRYYAAYGYGSVAEPELPAFVRREQAKLELVMRFVRGGSMVEIGPGPGMFTRVAQSAGFDMTAIEMDSDYSDQLRNLPGVRAIQSDDPAEVLPTLPSSDAVVMWHVIEHLGDPWRLLDSCAENLRPGGVLAISTPNPESLQFRLLGRHWVHVDAPRHLQLIPAGTVRSRLERLGMRHVLTTSTDPVGQNCNYMGWEYTLRPHPASHGPTIASTGGAWLITRTLSAVERRGRQGSTYTSLFLRPQMER
jgi:SAM-dependent methyltransferase